MTFRKCLSPTHMCSLCFQRTSYSLGEVRGEGEPKPMFRDNFTCNFTAQYQSCDICCEGGKWLRGLLQCLGQMLRLLQRILTSVYFSLQQSVTAAISDSAKSVFFLCVYEKKPFSSFDAKLVSGRAILLLLEHTGKCVVREYVVDGNGLNAAPDVEQHSWWIFLQVPTGKESPVNGCSVTDVLCGLFFTVDFVTVWWG